MNAFRRSLFVVLVAVAAVIAGTELRKFADSQAAPGPSPTASPTTPSSPSPTPTPTSTGSP